MQQLIKRRSVPNFLLFSASLFLLIYPILNRTRLSLFYSNGCFYILCLMAGYWAYLFMLDRLPKLSQMFREQADLKLGLLIGLLFTLMIVVSAGWHFRVLADETNILNISRNMLEHHRVENIIAGSWHFYDYHVIADEIDKRPLLFPFLIFIVHVLRGYNPSNAFILNTALCFIFISWIYYRLARYRSRLFALTGIFFVFSQPMMTEVVTCAGFDFLACFLMAYCCFLFYDFIRSEHEADFKWLWINLLVLANARYESIAVLGIALICFLGWRNVSRRWFTQNAIFAFTPILLAPRIWLLMLNPSTFESPDGKLWKISYFLEHNKMFFLKLFDFGLDVSFANAVTLLGLLACILSVQIIFKKTCPENKAFKRWAVFLLILSSVLWIETTSYHAGLPFHPVYHRYFVFFALFFSLAALWGIACIFNSIRAWSVILVVSFFIFINYHSITVRNHLTNYIYVEREFRFSLDYLLPIKKNNPSLNVIVVSPRACMYVPFNFGAYTPSLILRDKNSIRQNLLTNLYQGIYVIQQIQSNTKQPMGEYQIDSSYQLQTEREIYMCPEYFVRISRVVGIDLN